MKTILYSVLIELKNLNSWLVLQSRIFREGHVWIQYELYGDYIK